MFATAFARPPHEKELSASSRYLGELTKSAPGSNPLDEQNAWRDLAQSLFNTKEFIYIR